MRRGSAGLNYPAMAIPDHPRFRYDEFDREIWERDLDDFVPSRVWDMHTHLWNDAHAGSAAASGLRLDMDFEGLCSWGHELYPGRQMHHLVLGTPVVGMDAEGHNDWLAGQVAADPLSGVNMAVTPDMPAEYVDAQIERHGFVGLKPYRTFAPDPKEAAIRDFLPEPLIEVAHQRRLAVTMHLSKSAGPADFENLADLERYTREYPGVRWILAHCARGFNETFLAESIHFLKELPGIWYDTSAVNDLYAHYLLMKHEDRRRVMFGSDNVVAGCDRGKYITYAGAWQFFGGGGDLPHCDGRATLVVYEQLRQEKQVADMLGLTRAEIEDHFWGNAQRFFANLGHPPGKAAR